MSKGLRNIWSNHKLFISAIIAAIIVMGIVIVAGRTTKPAQAAPRPVEVQVVQVEQKDVPIYSECIGTTDGMVTAELTAEVIGYLLKQHYKEGSFVMKVQLVLEIDPGPFQA